MIREAITKLNYSRQQAKLITMRAIGMTNEEEEDNTTT
jgi:hypothetical protein